MEFKIKTLTPIWTGGINRTCDKLRETSILGSLRWWFEAIVRGLGGYVCDPTSENKCQLDQRKFLEGIRNG
ncbi:MAG: type III-B CRISPR module RAMP protein Cmr1, partial [Thermodesulfobacteria bacterium]|nr:type III-B CRISPR module RAMP protein Cmr1 [Thermodesulfobacteriota bacterium]